MATPWRHHLRRIPPISPLPTSPRTARFAISRTLKSAASPQHVRHVPLCRRTGLGRPIAASDAATMSFRSPVSSGALPLLQYPPARRDESVVDEFHGVPVADPYRWLEDPDAEEVKEFVERQVALTDSVLARCEEREKLRGQITALFDHPRYDTPYKRGGNYFYYHNTGLQAQSVLYVQVITKMPVE
ncbi:hypothetical protein GW17_00047444 [Ensete ventricosum]|nr:hypothetical protein GW17_00047444 [Ensete ventricosum]